MLGGRFVGENLQDLLERALSTKLREYTLYKIYKKKKKWCINIDILELINNLYD